MKDDLDPRQAESWPWSIIMLVAAWVVAAGATLHYLGVIQ